MRISKQVKVHWRKDTVATTLTCHISIEDRIRTLPQTRPRVVVTRAVVIKTGVFIELLAREQVWRTLRVGMFLNKRFAKREVFQMLENLAEIVGDVRRRTQMIGVIEVMRVF